MKKNCSNPDCAKFGRVTEETVCLLCGEETTLQWFEEVSETSQFKTELGTLYDLLQLTK